MYNTGTAAKKTPSAVYEPTYNTNIKERASLGKSAQNSLSFVHLLRVMSFPVRFTAFYRGGLGEQNLAIPRVNLFVPHFHESYNAPKLKNTRFLQ